MKWHPLTKLNIIVRSNCSDRLSHDDCCYFRHYCFLRRQGTKTRYMSDQTLIIHGFLEHLDVREIVHKVDDSEATDVFDIATLALVFPFPRSTPILLYLPWILDKAGYLQAQASMTGSLQRRGAGRPQVAQRCMTKLWAFRCRCYWIWILTASKSA